WRGSGQSPASAWRGRRPRRNPNCPRYSSDAVADRDHRARGGAVPKPAQQFSPITCSVLSGWHRRLIITTIIAFPGGLWPRWPGLQAPRRVPGAPLILTLRGLEGCEADVA